MGVSPPPSNMRHFAPHQKALSLVALSEPFGDSAFAVLRDEVRACSQRALRSPPCSRSNSAPPCRWRSGYCRTPGIDKSWSVSCCLHQKGLSQEKRQLRFRAIAWGWHMPPVIQRNGAVGDQACILRKAANERTHGFPITWYLAHFLPLPGFADSRQKKIMKILHWQTGMNHI